MTLIDEAVEEITGEEPCDLVGISIMTCYAPRAYELAAEFRKRGKTVGAWGCASHPIVLKRPFDTPTPLCAGRRRTFGPQVISDFEKGTLRRLYRMDQFPSLEQYRSPRVELLSPDAYMTRHCTFTTRGCHFDCEFCSVSPFNGKTTRRRPVPEVIEEMKKVKEWIRSEVVERMTKDSFLGAMKTAARIWVGLEEGSIVAFVDDLPQ